MFGNNKPFGTSAGFGSSTFGSSTPFGQTSTPFGAKPATSNVFGTSAFGVSTPSTGLFGSTSTTGTGLFGQPSTGFGTPASTSSGTFGFGGTSSSSGLFGNTSQPAQNTGGLFGGSTSAFGAPRPAFGGFGTNTSSTGLFGQSTNTGTGLFGSSGFSTTAASGTTIKFNPPTGTDTMMKGGVSTSIGTRHQCITCMKEYENKSLEELRLEDYVANRKGGASAGGLGFGNTTQQTGLFGSTPAASTSGFSFGNTTQSKPMFGTTGSTTAFGGTSNLFGQPAQNQNTGLFGKSVGFGAPTTSSVPAFNFGNSGTMGTGTSLFGQQQKPLFGQTTSTTGLFGNTATTQTTGFGTTSGFGGFGATNQQSTGLFGAKPTGLGTTSTTATNTFSFGNTNNMSGGLFGQKPAAPAFGGTSGFGTQASGFGSFGAAQPAGTGLFGQNKPATSMFGNTGSTFGSNLGTSFGTSSFPSLGLGANTGTGLFGTNTANKAPGFNFGGTGSTGFNFGANTNTQSFNFNPGSSLLNANDPNNAAAVQQAKQQILAMTSYPFGDSPLFRNPIKENTHTAEVLKPTNPTAQKALLSDSQYKVALLPTTKIKPKPWSPSPTGKTFLFDGLEDEEPSLGSVALLPKRSVKKLVLKNLGTSRSTLTLTSDITGSSNQPTRIDVSISLNKSPNTESSSVVQHSSIATSTSPSPLTVDIPDSTTKTAVTNVEADSSRTSDVNKSVSDGSIKAPEISTRPASSSMDDSIAALHTNKNVRGKAFHIWGSDTEDDILDNELSSESVNDVSGDSGSQSLQKSGVILRRPEYYTIPPVDYLSSMIDEYGNLFVEDFTIGRRNYGKVVFPGKTNIAGLNLDEIVYFGKKEVEVYPNDEDKPPVGEGLNKTAIVTLEKVWPTDKTNHLVISDPERVKKMGYVEKIKKSTAHLGAKFIDYIPQTGSWIFQVDHFSKYGLEDSDEEMDVSKPPENNMLLPVPPQIDKNGQVVPNSAMNNQLPLKSLSNKSKRAPVSADDEMDLTSHMFHDDFQLSDATFIDELYSPTRPLFSTQIDPEKIQEMKASFFQEADEEQWETLHSGVPKTGFLGYSDVGKKSFYPGLDGSRLDTSFNGVQKKQRYLEYGDEAYVSSLPYFKSVEADIPNAMSPSQLPVAKQPDWLSFPIVKSVQDLTKPSKQIHALNRIKLKPFGESVLWEKHNLLADAGFFMGRSFRPGWKANGTIIFVEPPIDNVPYVGISPKFFLYGETPSASNKSKNNGFNICLRKIGLLEDCSRISQRNLVAALKLQLENSVSTTENCSPLFVPKPGVELIHSLSNLFENQLKDADILDKDIDFMRQCVNIWSLLVSLWGKVRGIDDETVSNYAIQMARREALSSWLIKSSELVTSKELATTSQSNYLYKIFLYLSCRRISDAVKLAQVHKDFRLSLLLSQADGTAIVRKWICNQLFNWEESGAYKFMKHERLKLYALLAGLLIWDNIYETVNCCQNLDWKKSLSLHLWYFCNPTASIQNAVEEYDRSFQGTDNGKKYSLPPYPPYVDYLEADLLRDIGEACEDLSGTVYDTCYHLLKLYCNRAHRLDQLLMPETYTNDHLDYRASWLVHLALSSVGYNVPQELSSTLHVNFAAQLEAMDMWEWAVFVFLHHPDDDWRMKNIKDILLRHVSLEDNEEKEKFLQESLLVPSKWIYEAKAIKAHSLRQHSEEAWFLLKAEFWNKSHAVVIRHIASDAVINEDYDYLMKFLSELSVPERCSTILDWSSGGQVYLDYINICRMLQNVLNMETSAYDLERFTPEIHSLCRRLSSIPTPTLKDRLSVTEMAKKTATIMRSIAMLQANKLNDNSSLINLPNYIKLLPMPYDYAASEFRFVAHCFLSDTATRIEV